jgi:cell division protein FtsN
MTRDYKPTASRQKPAGKNNAFFTGLLVGMILGIGISVGVAIMVTGGKSPFIEHESATDLPGTIAGQNMNSEDALPSETQEEKPEANRFDFYKILPGESQVTDQELQQSKEAQQQNDMPAGAEQYFLQVGAFQTEQEADNMKAKLALLGLEAVVQTATVPDKGVWHRVRVGPYSDLDQISKARAELTKSGFNADLIKIHSNVPDQ